MHAIAWRRAMAFFCDAETHAVDLKSPLRLKPSL
jgi:hypothetical protein